MDITTVIFIILAVIVALAIAVFQYFYRQKSKSKTIILLTFLRFLGIFSILLLLINPKIKNRVLEVTKPSLVVAIDNSSSIKFLDNHNQVSKLISDIKSNEVLNEKFNIDYFSFDSKLELLDSLNFNVNSTNIREALVSLDDIYKEEIPTILITDGNHTLGADYEFHRSKGTVYPIIVGDTVKNIDLEINKLNANRYSFLGNNFPVELFVNYNGNEQINSVLTVKNGNTTVFRKNISLNEEKNSEQISFNLTASKVGVMNYRASLSPLNEEENRLNNQKNFSVEVIDEQSKIAIISDIKHPDLGMYKRAIESNKQRKVIYHTSNVSGNTLNQYQLVILYQPTVSFKKLFDELKEKAINSFIITGTHTDWNFLNTIQPHFKKSVISQTEDYTANFNDDYAAFVVDDLGFEDFPPLNAYFGEVVFSSPFESILFQNIGGFKTESPLLATYLTEGKRGAVLFGENSWKWRALSFTKNKSFEDFDSFVNKLIQYLAVKKAFNRIELSYNTIAYQNDLVKISAKYFDNNYTLDTRAKLNLNLKNLRTNEMKQYPMLLNNDTFELNLNDLTSAEYEFHVSVEGQTVKRRGNFTVLDYNIEQQFTHANINAMKTIAATSGGQWSHINNTRTIIDTLIENAQYKSVQKSTDKIVPIIDWKWLLGFVVFFFSLEWFIRKYRGLI